MSNKITGADKAHQTGRLRGHLPPPEADAATDPAKSPPKDSSSVGSKYRGYEATGEPLAGGRGKGGGGTGGVKLDDENDRLAGGRGKGGTGTGGRAEPHEADHTGTQFAGGRGGGRGGTGGVVKEDEPPEQMMT